MQRLVWLSIDVKQRCKRLSGFQLGFACVACRATLPNENKTFSSGLCKTVCRLGRETYIWCKICTNKYTADQRRGNTINHYLIFISCSFVINVTEKLAFTDRSALVSTLQTKCESFIQTWLVRTRILVNPTEHLVPSLLYFYRSPDKSKNILAALTYNALTSNVNDSSRML